MTELQENTEAASEPKSGTSKAAIVAEVGVLHAPSGKEISEIIESTRSGKILDTSKSVSIDALFTTRQEDQILKNQFEDRLNKLEPAQKDSIIQNIESIMNSSKLLFNLQKQELAKSLVERISIPNSSRQNTDFTCTQAAQEEILVSGHPELYVKYIADWATTGETTGTNGETIKSYDMSNHVEEKTGDIPVRLLSSQIFQFSSMEYSIGEDYIYDATNKIAVSKNANTSFTGNFPKHYVRGFQAFIPQEKLGLRSSTNLTSNEIASSRGELLEPDQLTNEIAESLKTNPAGVMAELHFSESGEHSLHMVVVKEIRDGRVYFSNSWGANANKGPTRWTEDNGLESMTIANWNEKVTAATIVGAESNVAVEDRLMSNFSDFIIFANTETKTVELHMTMENPLGAEEFIINNPNGLVKAFEGLSEKQNVENSDTQERTQIKGHNLDDDKKKF